MPDLVNKLSTYAALLGVIGAIGGGFMAWGEFNNRIAQLENKEFVVNETVDLSDINQKIENLIKEIETLKGFAGKGFGEEEPEKKDDKKKKKKK